MLDAGHEPQSSKLALPPITLHEGRRVIRGDLIEGGFKRLAIDGVFKKSSKDNLVFATNSFGFGALALTLSLQHSTKHPIIFLSKSDSMSPNLEWCRQLGATLDFSGHANVADSSALADQARDKYDSESHEVLPLGLENEEVRKRIAVIVKQILPNPPEEIWMAVASGLLIRTIQSVFPSTKFHAVLVKGNNPDIGRAQRHIPEERFDEPAKLIPPYPSAKHYDAKVWRIAIEQGSSQSMIFNVA